MVRQDPMHHRGIPYVVASQYAVDELNSSIQGDEGQEDIEENGS